MFGLRLFLAQSFAKKLYIVTVILLILLLGLDYIPSLHVVLQYLSPAFVLFLGLVYAFVFGQAYPKFNAKVSKKLLQYAIVGLGFGMNIEASLASGTEGMLFTIVSVFGTLLLGMLIGLKLLKLNRNTAYLISSGTAICGGSAIAAVAPVINAKDEDISVALSIVFVLNAIALFIFPSIGRFLGMSQQDFGTWAAIAIHDTSSVVGAAAAYGEDALELATMIKLTRALWIIPVALLSAVLFKSKERKLSIPYFILFFILAMIINSYVLTDYPQLGVFVSSLAKKVMILTMFFIGASMSRDILKNIGHKALLMGALLWVIISSISLFVILIQHSLII